MSTPATSASSVPSSQPAQPAQPSAPAEILPAPATLLQAAKIAIEQDRAIMLDYYRQTANATAFLGEDPETKERILVKSKDEFTSLINSLPELRANLTIQENSPKKIIIKRDRGSKGKQRNICKGVFDYIASLGFTEIICKNYTVSEQANLFYNAEVIVSPHGADLANMIFCQSDCNVIELSNGYNPGLFNSHVNNALRNKKIFLQKKIIFNENIMQNNILFQKTHLSDRYSKLCGTRLFEIGKRR